jgi:hypothetical protein
MLKQRMLGLHTEWIIKASVQQRVQHSRLNPREHCIFRRGTTRESVTFEVCKRAVVKAKHGVQK